MSTYPKCQLIRRFYVLNGIFVLVGNVNLSKMSAYQEVLCTKRDFCSCGKCQLIQSVISSGVNLRRVHCTLKTNLFSTKNLIKEILVTKLFVLGSTSKNYCIHWICQCIYKQSSSKDERRWFKQRCIWSLEISAQA